MKSRVFMWVLAAAVCGAGCRGKPAATPPDRPASKGAPATPEGPPVDPDAPLGVAPCDTYVERYSRCMDRMDEAARPSARAAFRQTRASWHHALRYPDGRTAVTEACHQALAALPTVCPEAMTDGGTRVPAPTPPTDVPARAPDRTPAVPGTAP